MVLIIMILMVVVIVSDQQVSVRRFQVTVLQQVFMVVVVCPEIVVVGKHTYTLQVGRPYEQGGAAVTAGVFAQSRQAAQRDVEIFEGVEEENAGDDGEESAEVSKNVLDVHGLPLLVQYKGGYHDK
jgi:hypothetical protein